MRCKVITFKRNTGIGAKSQKPYDFQVIGAFVKTANGVEFAEFMLDKEALTPETGKEYEMEISAFPDREKRLTFRVNALVPVQVPAK